MFKCFWCGNIVSFLCVCVYFMELENSCCRIKDEAMVKNNYLEPHKIIVNLLKCTTYFNYRISHVNKYRVMISFDLCIS